MDGRIVHTNGVSPRLAYYRFKSDSGSATLEGYFVDAAGRQITPYYAFTIPDDAERSFDQLYDAAESATTGVPETAVGFWITYSSAAIWFGVTNGAYALSKVSPRSHQLAAVAATSPTGLGMVNG